MKSIWLGCVLAVLLVTAIGIASPRSVASAAREIAGDAPFCIQVADDARDDYKPARAWLDLSAFTMRARSGSMVENHHAILVVGDEMAPRLFYWSYWRQTFVAGVLNEQTWPPALACMPERGFLDRLPVLFGKGGGTQYIRFSPREAYRIPRGYQPRWSGGHSRILSLMVAAPDFTLMPARWDDMSPKERDSNSLFIEWNPQWLLGLVAAAPSGEVVRRDMAFGLRHRAIVWHGRDGKTYDGDEYVAAAGPDSNVTHISCGASSAAFAKSCQHRFLYGGRHFYFRHRPEEVVRWQAMQRTVINLLASFEVR